MLNVLISALTALWTYIAGPLIIQATIYGFLLLFVVEVMTYIAGKACSGGASGDCGLSASMSAIPPSVWYWMDFAQIPTLITILLGSYVIRFAIRRIPLIG